MQNFLKKDLGYRTDIEISYSAILREYYIGSQFRLAITHCPWCGTKLPPSLRKEYRQLLRQDYGLEVELYTTRLDQCNNPKTDAELRETLEVPEEFKSDDWWKSRGL
jgi:hypothetical protein